LRNHTAEYEWRYRVHIDLARDTVQRHAAPGDVHDTPLKTDGLLQYDARRRPDDADERWSRRSEPERNIGECLCFDGADSIALDVGKRRAREFQGRRSRSWRVQADIPVSLRLNVPRRDPARLGCTAAPG
jgi:hypothetical protein